MRLILDSGKDLRVCRVRELGPLFGEVHRRKQPLCIALASAPAYWRCECVLTAYVRRGYRGGSVLACCIARILEKRLDSCIDIRCGGIRGGDRTAFRAGEGASSDKRSVYLVGVCELLGPYLDEDTRC